MNKVIFSGVQPSGNLHIGNYIGALEQWKKLQNEAEAFFCIVDLHAITVPQDPKVLREKILEIAALYIAVGIDPNKSHVFVQSENPDHASLAWILNSITTIGQLRRMTQFKDKTNSTGVSFSGAIAGAQKPSSEEAGVGLFDYPVLMAADILLYETDEVPVGEDQKQHIELTRDLAEKFNKVFGEIFKLPQPRIQKETARIMSLQDPTKKMSKSDKDPLGTINLLDTEDQITEKFRRAVTDSGSEIVFGEDKPAISNLLTIYSVFSKESPQEVENTFRGKSYSEFKNLLADLVVSELLKIQEEYNRVRENKGILKNVLDEGLNFATNKSSQTLRKVKEAVGLGR